MKQGQGRLREVSNWPTGPDQLPACVGPVSGALSSRYVYQFLPFRSFGEWADLAGEKKKRFVYVCKLTSSCNCIAGLGD